MKAKRQKSDDYGLAGARVLLAFFAFVLFAACNPLLAQANSPAGDLFKSKCVLCHGADGTGQTPLGKQLQAADLGSKEVQKLTNADIRKQIHDGRANMPGFGDQLSDEQITQLVQYVRQFGKAKKKK